VQYNPDIKNRRTWHCGGGKQSSYGGTYYQICTNTNSIGIEICSTSSNGSVVDANDSRWYFTDAVVK
jgi:N-acetylmuramoyl-L-alanine amidase CwlA